MEVIRQVGDLFDPEAVVGFARALKAVRGGQG
jgi:hypothetical protein